MAKDGVRGRLDPAFDAHVKPIAAWATAWWEDWRSPEQLTQAFRDADAALRRSSTSTSSSSNSSSTAAEQSLWHKVKGPTAAAILSAARLGWHFQGPHSLTTDTGDMFDMRLDSPAAIVVAIQQSVVRWRAANVLQSFTATRTLLQSPARQPPPSVLPTYSKHWKRAQAMATIRMGLPSLDATNNGKKHKMLPKSWSPKYGPYLVSAMANKQWPQARVAAAKGAGWTKDPTCRLCNDAPGTHLHRHSCPVSWPGQREACPGDVAEDAMTRTHEQLELWRTRGIGGTRVFTPPRQTDPTIQWLKPIPNRVLFHKLDWYVDASQIDASTEEAARFGVGAVAVSQSGELVAAVRAVPPACVKSIPSAEAWGMAPGACQHASQKVAAY